MWHVAEKCTDNVLLLLTATTVTRTAKILRYTYIASLIIAFTHFTHYYTKLQILTTTLLCWSDLSHCCSDVKCYYLANFLRIISRSLILICSHDHLRLHPLIWTCRKRSTFSLNTPWYTLKEVSHTDGSWVICFFRQESIKSRGSTA